MFNKYLPISLYSHAGRSIGAVLLSLIHSLGQSHLKIKFSLRIYLSSLQNQILHSNIFVNPPNSNSPFKYIYPSKFKFSLQIYLSSIQIQILHSNIFVILPNSYSSFKYICHHSKKIVLKQLKVPQYFTQKKHYSSLTAS